MSDPRRQRLQRRLARAAGAALLSVAAAGCSGLGRSAVGTITYEDEKEHHTMVTSPGVKGCHKLGAAGAVKVENLTLNDIRLYLTPDCEGRDPAYVPSRLSDTIVPGTEPWRSYTVVH
ncbi:hypothetical protein [Streptomyces purpureus]|uniref:Lipoprotein n=1 Tax=Streptomyces purpureus TaxID=1951 RepID=A0A918LM80_9ACTN|nr:hypothetical protein [Streptomyces purpureus]GGT23907.1 hypothetical protein GCM10014713_16120 [Streptomyces purpureus]